VLVPNPVEEEFPLPLPPQSIYRDCHAPTGASRFQLRFSINPVGASDRCGLAPPPASVEIDIDFDIKERDGDLSRAWEDERRGGIGDLGMAMAMAMAARPWHGVCDGIRSLQEMVGDLRMREIDTVYMYRNTPPRHFRRTRLKDEGGRPSPASPACHLTSPRDGSGLFLSSPKR
jgi:hypothetical protein